MGKLHRELDEICALTDSPPSAIHWRLKDYAAILRAELAILAAPDLAPPVRSRSSTSRELGTL
jgi:hypothetical protein